MPDPFQPKNSEAQLMREAKIGFSMVLLVVCVLGYWGWAQYQRAHFQIPEHIRNAPVARQVGPDEYLAHIASPEVQTGTIPVQDQPATRSSSGPVHPLPQNGENRISRFESHLPEPSRLATRGTPKAIRDTTDPPHQSPLIGHREVADTHNQAKRSIESADTRKTNQLQPQKDPIRIAELDREPNRSFDPANDFQPPTSVAANSQPITQSTNPVRNPSEFDLSRQLRPFDAAVPSIDTDVGDVKADQEIKPVVFEQPLRAVEDTSDTDFAVSGGTEPVTDNQFETVSFQPVTAKDTDDAQPEAVSFDPSPAHTNGLEPSMDSESHLVGKGESFWSIAQQHYGNGQYFRALYEKNRELAAEDGSPVPGTTIHLPPVETLDQLTSSAASHLQERSQTKNGSAGRIYSTRQGDTLFDIARQQMGQASRYLELMELNRDRIPGGTTHLSRLPENISLKLPTR